MTPQQTLFCKLYTTKGDTFCNATISYSIAYDIEIPTDEKGKRIVDSKEYNQCQANGSRLFANDIVKKTIEENMVALLNDTTIDARLSEIALNGQESNSIQAVKIYNDLKQRITKKIDITTANRPLVGLSDDELKAIAGE